MTADGEPREYPTRPFVGVGVVVLKGDDVLLIRRGKPPRRGEWSLPGGMQEVGETVAEAGAREVLEETGITIGPGVLIDVVDAIRHDDDGRVVSHYTLVDLAARYGGGEPVAGDDAMDARWVPLAEVDDHVRWSETKRIVAMAAGVLAASRPPS